jgi:hypothetical protein
MTIVEEEIPQRPPSPLKDASWCSQLYFGWAYPILKLGATRPLQEPDLPDLDPVDTSAYNRNKVEQIWETERRSKRDDKNLGRALFRDYLKSIWRAQLCLAANMMARIGQALALGLLLEQFDANINGIDKSSTTTTQRGYLWALVIVLCGLIAFPSKQRQFFETYRKG